MDAISSLLQPSTDSTAKPNGFSALGSEDFVKIIFTELSKQDPLKPSDTDALLQQLSTLRSIQSDMDLSDKLKTLVGQNEMSSAAGLIGQKVSGISLGNERITDTVASVSRTSGGPVLTLRGGQKVAMSKVDEILPGDATPPPAASATTTTGGT